MTTKATRPTIAVGPTPDQQKMAQDYIASNAVHFSRASAIISINRYRENTLYGLHVLLNETYGRKDAHRSVAIGLFEAPTARQIVVGASHMWSRFRTSKTLDELNPRQQALIYNSSILPIEWKDRSKQPEIASRVQVYFDTPNTTDQKKFDFFYGQ